MRDVWEFLCGECDGTEDEAAEQGDEDLLQVIILFYLLLVYSLPPRDARRRKGSRVALERLACASKGPGYLPVDCASAFSREPRGSTTGRCSFWYMGASWAEARTRVTQDIVAALPGVTQKFRIFD